jgi:predicted methyltransferase
VVEIWPGGGWYTEILAPYLAERGTYYAGRRAGNGAKR